METRLSRIQWIRIGAAGACAVAAVALWWPVWRTLCAQLAAGYVLMALALPICTLLEKKLKPTPASVAALAVLTLAMLLLALGIIPPLARQVKQMSDALPGIIATGQTWLAQLQEWLTERGVDVTPVRDEIFTQAGKWAGMAATYLAGAAARTVNTVSRLFLAPLLAFYLLRDRKRIAQWLMLLLPVRWRRRAVRASREMRRETVGFLRGQMLISGAVGFATAIGLLAVGHPGWLLMGLLMGALEMVPYLGPLLAGTPAVLLALPRGLAAALWTLGVIVLVQQLEGTILSPRLLSSATKLHPLAVLMAITAGGIVAGTLGMLLVLPLVVSVRGALRGLRTL